VCAIVRVSEDNNDNNNDKGQTKMATKLTADKYGTVGEVWVWVGRFNAARVTQMEVCEISPGVLALGDALYSIAALLGDARYDSFEAGIFEAIQNGSRKGTSEGYNWKFIPVAE